MSVSRRSTHNYKEAGALAHLTNDLDLAVHLLRDELGDAQAKTGALHVKLSRVVELTEVHEQVSQVFFADALTMVPHLNLVLDELLLIIFLTLAEVERVAIA